VYRIRVSGLESSRIQHILNKPHRVLTTVLFNFPKGFSNCVVLGVDANTIIKRIVQRFKGCNVVHTWAQFCCKMWEGSFFGNQYSHRVDAKVMFYVYRFPIIFLEVF